jgi:hypothetical protein
VAVALGGDADRDRDLVAVPVDRRREPQDDEGVLFDRVLAGEGAVRDRHTLADVGGHRVLALEHRVDVRLVDRAGVDEGLTRLADGLVT